MPDALAVTRSTELSLSTKLRRFNTDGMLEAYDVIVFFTYTHRSAGFSATRVDPEDPAEYEFEFLRADFDGGEPDDAPGPLTSSELVDLQYWFDSHYAEAWQVAEAAWQQDRRDDPSWA